MSKLFYQQTMVISFSFPDVNHNVFRLCVIYGYLWSNEFHQQTMVNAMAEDTVSAPSMYYIYSTVLKHNDKLAVEHIQQGGIKRIYAGN
jgi:hypothetical protein